MSITIEYGTALASAFSPQVGIKGYMDYYSSTYSSPSHAAHMGFDGGPVGAVDLGGTNYNPIYFGTNVIGKYLHNTSTSSNVDFLITGGEVDIENGAGVGSTIDYMFYTGGTNPNHTLSGFIEELTFGGGGYNSGTNELNTSLFKITGLGDAIGNGFVDSDSDGLYDGILGRLSTTPNNLVHDLVLDLMGGGISGEGGPHGPGSTSVLENFLDAYGTTQIGALDGSTVFNERFDPFAAVDTFVLNGGVDVINEGFQVGSGGDVIDLSGFNTFADENAALNNVFYSTLFGNAFLTYQDASSNFHAVQIIGVTSGLTVDNFIV